MHPPTAGATHPQAPLHLVLYEPEIPPNTGNIMRLCANTGCHLHLVKPLGFSLEGKQLRRAGLDYRDLARVQSHGSWAQCRAHFAGRRIFALSTHGKNSFFEERLCEGDVLLFGPESRGLPAEVRSDPALSATLRLPMQTDSRSMNLSNAVAVCAYEGLRQLNFPGLA